MLIEYLYSHWQSDGEDLWSFAAISNKPPPKVAFAGRDCCIIAIKEEHMDAWLDQGPKKIDALYAILEGRQRLYLYYGYRMAA